MKRWLVLPLGLAIAAAAAWALLTMSPVESAEPRRPGPPAHDVIDEDSREALREILREAGEVEP